MRTRRGTVYVFCLMLVMLVSVIGLSSMMLARAERRGASGGADAAAARLYAESAIETGLAMMRANSSWATSPGEGVWFADTTIGEGTMTLTVAFQAANVAGGTRPVVMIGTGRKGEAAQSVQVTLTPATPTGGLVISPGSWQRRSL